MRNLIISCLVATAAARGKKNKRAQVYQCPHDFIADFDICEVGSKTGPNAGDCNPCWQHQSTNPKQDGLCCYEDVTEITSTDFEGNLKLAFFEQCRRRPYCGLDKYHGGCYRIPCMEGDIQNCATNVDCPECPMKYTNDGEGCCRRTMTKKLPDGKNAGGMTCARSEGFKHKIRVQDPMNVEVQINTINICMSGVYRVTKMCIPAKCMNCNSLWTVSDCRRREIRWKYKQYCTQNRGKCSAYGTENNYIPMNKEWLGRGRGKQCCKLTPGKDWQPVNNGKNHGTKMNYNPFCLTGKATHQET